MLAMDGDKLEKGEVISTEFSENVNPPSRKNSFFRLLRKLTFSSRTPTLVDDGEPCLPFEPPPVIVRKLNDHKPGYPLLAAFQDSDECFMLYRRFGYLQSRVLSDKQDQLRALEKELARFDNELYEAKYTYTQTRTQISDKALRDRRVDLMNRITEAYCAYSKMLTAASRLVALHRPAKSDYRSVLSFCTDEPLCQAETSWIQHREDLITLKPGREHAWLDAIIEHLLRWFHCSLLERLFCSSETRQKTEGRGVATIKDGRLKPKEVYYTKSRIEVLVNLILLIIILALLIVPTYLLYHIVEVSGGGRADGACMCVLLVATLAFSAVLAAFTRARRHEILAAAAAYCAVLVVFLGNVPQGGNALVTQSP